MTISYMSGINFLYLKKKTKTKWIILNMRWNQIFKIRDKRIGNGKKMDWDAEAIHKKSFKCYTFPRYVVHSISIQTLLVQAFKIDVDSEILLLHIL